MAILYSTLHKKTRLELLNETENGSNTTILHRLHIHRGSSHNTINLMKTCQNIAEAHTCVRGKGWGSVGEMYSAGYNVGYKGRISKVVVPSKIKTKYLAFLRSIENNLLAAGTIFEKEFFDKDVGYVEMIKLQDTMWPLNRKPPYDPACWVVSHGLGNPLHVNDDCSHSYAGWFCSSEINNRSAWFLFPQWGVSIELCNDTWISWDGRNCAHCSSVPHLQTSNHIFSLLVKNLRDP